MKTIFSDMDSGSLHISAQKYCKALWRFFSSFGATPMNGNQVVAGQPGL